MDDVRELTFTKGHGTSNDFIVINDVDGVLELSAADVRFLCDRRRGLGADGVLRVVRTQHMVDYSDMADQAEFFMDYRNADGSLAEMCGNGARVFVRFLDATGLATMSTGTIATRGGLRNVVSNADLTVTIDMGVPAKAESSSPIVVDVGGRYWPATGVLIPNPHAVVFVENLDHAGTLESEPNTEPASAFPDGVNVEFVTILGADHLSFRVYERGVGQTLSCGTGACAVAWAYRRRQNAEWSISIDGDQSDASVTTRVDVPGGVLHVTERGDGHVLLTGPVDIVARGIVLLP